MVEDAAIVGLEIFASLWTHIPNAKLLILTEHGLLRLFAKGRKIEKNKSFQPLCSESTSVFSCRSMSLICWQSKSK